MHCRPLLAVAALMLSSGPEVQAQEEPRRVQELEKVTITGSNLPRTDGETSAPVQIIGRDEIVRSGAVSLKDVLQTLPANNYGTFNEADAVNNYGAATVSLRGLGPKSTLVLINGRRVAPFGVTGGATFVDVNQIPASMIDRVEVLLDGASAIYGSDAVAGVVNVILRRDHRGIEATAGYGVSTHGDARQRQASLTVGIGDRQVNGYNVFAGLAHSDQEPVKATERWHSRSADYRGFGLPDFRSSSAYPGNLYSTNNAAFLQPLAPCATIGEAGSALVGRCVYDQARDSDLVVGSRRDALIIAGSAELGGGFELFGDALFSRNVFEAQHTSVAAATYGPPNGTLPQPFIPLPVGHPQNPYPFEVALRTRFADVPFVVTPTSETARIVAGVRHQDLAGWDVQSALLWSRSKTDGKINGVIHDPVLTGEVLDANGRASPSFRFGDPGANDPALMARLYPTLDDVSRTSTASLDVRGTREVFALAGGPAQLAVGAEVRRERYRSALDPRTAAGEVSVLFGNQADGARTVAAAYGELGLPIAKTLEATVAARLDHYSDFGATVNPKAGLKWKASPGVALRATYASSFRAPSLSETAQSAVPGFATVRDPQTCPELDPSNPNCTLQVKAISSGNPELRPERARSVTAGLVVEPWRDASFTVDAFRIHRRDEIAYIDPAYLLANESAYPGYVVRRPDGTIESLNLQYTNLAQTRVWGIDVSAKAKTTIAGVGRVGIDGSYECLPHYWLAPTQDSPLLDYAGTYEQPKSRARVSVTLDNGPWSTALSFNYTSGYLRAFSPSDLSCPYDAGGANRPELCSIKPWHTLDLFVGWRGTPGLELGFLIRNLDNVQAPFDERQILGPFRAYNPAYHSAVGRFFQVTAKYAFR